MYAVRRTGGSGSAVAPTRDGDSATPMPEPQRRRKIGVCPAPGGLMGWTAFMSTDKRPFLMSLIAS